ncbi:MAG: polysaccharide pyruvyl transferase family protein [Chitinophagaceae bacterium]
MAELKERIKDFVGDLYFKWIFGKLRPGYEGLEQGNFLLLPPSNLDGSFGDELMVNSFVANFSGKSQVTIFTDHLIHRDDFLGQYEQVRYRHNFQVRNYGRWVAELRKASAVFIIGADALDGIYSTRHSLRYLRLAMMAHKMGKPVYFSGFSLSKNATEPAKQALAEVSKFALLKARDVDSYNRLATFVPRERLLQVSDMAFVCPYSQQIEQSDGFQLFIKWIEQKRSENKRIVAVCPNSIQAHKIGGGKYIAGLKSLLDAFKSQGNMAFLYLYHDTRPLFDEISDLDISRELYVQYAKEDTTHAFFTENIPNGIALKSYLRYADFTMTGRMHFGISGLEAGKPMFGICYAHKFEGMLRLFEIEPDNALVDYTEMDKGGEVVAKFLNDLDNQHYRIEKNTEKINQLSFLNGQDIAWI